jgi:hypothetical protein
VDTFSILFANFRGVGHQRSLQRHVRCRLPMFRAIIFNPHLRLAFQPVADAEESPLQLGGGLQVSFAIAYVHNIIAVFGDAVLAAFHYADTFMVVVAGKQSCFINRESGGVQLHQCGVSPAAGGKTYIAIFVSIQFVYSGYGAALGVARIGFKMGHYQFAEPFADTLKHFFCIRYIIFVDYLLQDSGVRHMLEFPPVVMDNNIAQYLPDSIYKQYSVKMHAVYQSIIHIKNDCNHISARLTFSFIFFPFTC